MSFKDKLLKKAASIDAKSVKSAGGKVLDALAYPQKIAMQQLASSIGLKAEETSEQNAQNIVEKTAMKLGIPEDSTAGNMAKAAAVAGLEVFGDPLSVIPVGKIKKGFDAVKKIAPKAGLAADVIKGIDKAADMVKGLKTERKVVEKAPVSTITKASVASKADDLAKPLPKMNSVTPPEQVLKDRNTSFTGKYFGASKPEPVKKTFAEKLIDQKANAGNTATEKMWRSR